MVDTALFNITYEYVVKEVDVLVIDVRDGVQKDVESVILTIHQRVDFVYRQTVIDLIKSICSQGDLLFYLQELDDDFFEVLVYLVCECIVKFNFEWEFIPL